MAHSIRNFVKGVPDVNTGNRYKVEIFLPVRLQQWNGALDRIQFYCQECTLPPNDLTQIEKREYGQKRMLGSFRDSGTTTISFIFDYKGLNIKFFEAWQNYIMKPDTKRMEYYANYVGRVRITLLNNLNQPIYICNLEEAYPVKVSQISLGYSQSEILPIEVEWWFRSKTYVTYNSDAEVTDIIESAIKDGQVQNGAIVDSTAGQLDDVVTEVLGTINEINDTVDRIRTVGRIVDIYF